MRAALAVLSLLLLAACGGDGGGVAPPEFHRVVVSGEGTGAGLISSTQRDLFECPVAVDQQCAPTFENGTSLRVEATADAASRFHGWGADAGSCGTATSCTVTVDRDLNLVARFDLTAQGAWSGLLGAGLTISLTVSEVNGKITGSGTIGRIGVAVTGSYEAPAVLLTFSAEGFENSTLTGTLTRTTIVGTIDGAGFHNAAVTLDRR